MMSSSLDSFLPRPCSPGHGVARNPGACVVSGQGVDAVVLDSFLPRPFSPGPCVARNPGACVVSGQGVDEVVLDSFLPAPSALVIVLHETLEPAWCPGKVLTQWSWILSFSRPFSPGHCVARNPGACVVSGQGVDAVVLDSFLPPPLQSWSLCCTKPWSLRGVRARC